MYFLQYVLDISKSKLTFYNFTSQCMPMMPPANEDDLVVTLHHHSCVLIPLSAGNGFEIKCKAIGYFIQPQCCVVSPSILATAPRDAISPGVHPTARHKPVVDDREGVAPSPLGGE